jgi:hypothetical protein
MVLIVIMLILSIILTVLVGKVVFANSFGTFKAYAIGYFWIWFICFVVIACVFNKIGLFKLANITGSDSQSDSSQTAVIDNSESETSILDDSSENSEE